jgi:hypothetical protein
MADRYRGYDREYGNWRDAGRRPVYRARYGRDDDNAPGFGRRQDAWERYDYRVGGRGMRGFGGYRPEADEEYYERANRGWDEGMDERDHGEERGYRAWPYNRGRYAAEESQYRRSGQYGRRYRLAGAYTEYTPTGWRYTAFWLVPGPYTGVGPSDFQRSDERVREDVNAGLTQHGQIDARNIHVDVNDCEVSLRGEVDSREQKRLAEDIAEAVPGVTDVHNELRVRGRGRARGRPSADLPQGQIRRDMRVLGRDSMEIGRIKEIRGSDFLIDRSLQRDVYAPFSAVQRISDNDVSLNVLSGEVDDQGWEMPRLLGTGTTQGRQ